MSKTITAIKVPVNDGFYGKPDSDIRGIRAEFDKKRQQALKKLYESNNTAGIWDKDTKEYCGVSRASFRKKNAVSESGLIYEVRKEREEYFLRTGLYVGYLNIEGAKIEINTGYNNCFLKRMLNVANNIYYDFSKEENGAQSDDNNVMSAILEYLFLTNFKIAFAHGLPSHYLRIQDKGLNIKGKIDINRYLSEDVLFGDKISFSYSQREYVQDIVDLLFLTMKSIDSNKNEYSLLKGDYARYYRQLRQLYSGKKVSYRTIKNIEKHSSLSNPLFVRYRKVLYYAKLILQSKGIFYAENSTDAGIPGFLIDISELWEVYLEKILRNHFVDYNVEAQKELALYNNTFFNRSNFPDIVMESSDTTIILDAKFKTMKFEGKDIDRNDLHQIHSYAGYYNSLNKQVKLAALIYPTEVDPGNQILKTNLYGLNSTESKFEIGYIKIGKTYEKMLDNERDFLKRMEESIRE